VCDLQAGVEHELAVLCKVRLAGAEDLCAHTPALSPVAQEDCGYQTRRQKRDSTPKGLLITRESVVPRDLLPPPGMPQGTVSYTPTSERETRTELRHLEMRLFVLGCCVPTKSGARRGGSTAVLRASPF